MLIQATFKAALVNILILTIDQTNTCNVTGVAHSYIQSILAFSFIVLV